jgi:hypothetical protein
VEVWSLIKLDSLPFLGIKPTVLVGHAVLNASKEEYGCPGNHLLR